MLNLIKIAVTGGLSCGKSSACRFFKEFGAYVVSADEIVHKLLLHDAAVGQKIIDLIGQEIVVNHQIDRSLIAKKVFSHPHLLQALEAILHPAVQEEVEKQYQQAQGLKAPLFVVEIPLLFETGAERFFDYTLTIVATPDLCQQRYSLATGSSVEEFEKRSARQMPLEEKRKRSDFVIVNQGSFDEMKQHVKRIYTQLTQ